MEISPAAANAPERSGDALSHVDEVAGEARKLARAQARVAELEAELARQARVRSELIYLVSHEFRTPITIISGFARLLKTESQGELNEEQHHFIDESLKACRRLDRFVSDLLDACPDTGSPLAVVPTKATEADLHATILGQLESMSPLLDERGLSLDLDLGLSSFDLSFDAGRIEQVITNLTTNAIRYGRPNGRVRIMTRPARHVVSCDHSAAAFQPAAEVSVEDDGPGIPIEDRERLFAPYVRGAGSETETQENCDGLGIGLSICRRILTSHGGTIRVETSPLGGARFVFTLPGSPRPVLED